MKYFSTLITIASLLLAVLLPRQVHAQCDTTPDFPSDGTHFRQAVTQYLAGTWIGSIGGTTYGSIDKWCTRQITDMAQLFLNQATFNADISGWDTSAVTTMQGMFHGASIFDKDIGSWTVTSVANFRGMFNSAAAFNQNIGGWITSGATDMHSMFWKATAFNQDIGGGNWDTTSVTNMAFMFNQASNFNQNIGVGSNWNTAVVTNMRSMFSQASAFDQDISTWSTNAVTDMATMFFQATQFNADISGWTVNSVNDMQSMFQGATSFDKDISGWTVSSVTNMISMFNGATSFNQDISSWTLSTSDIDMHDMFYGATSFDKDLSTWDISSVTKMEGMFQLASQFNQNLCSWRLDFPYDSASGIFTDSGCVHKDDPIEGVKEDFCSETCVTLQPSISSQPSSKPSSEPSLSPSESPSKSSAPSDSPSDVPSDQPSDIPSSEPSSEPSSTPSCSPSANPTSSPSVEGGVNLFYPDWANGGGETCRNDGDHPDYMEINPTEWLSSSLDACCRKFFGGFLYKQCIGAYPPDADDCNVMLFYPDWNGSNEGCVDDGQEPLYMLGNAQYFLSNTREECCEKFYEWNYYACAGIAPEGSGNYYPDWNGSPATCKNDGGMPDYMLNPSNTQWYLYSTLEECCESHFNYELNTCLGNTVSGSNEWYVVYSANTCVQDCIGTSTDCGGLVEGAWVETFSSKRACCDAKLWYYPDCIRTNSNN